MNLVSPNRTLEGEVAHRIEGCYGVYVEDEPKHYTVSEAARVLGITEAAVRARINRGKLESEKVENTVYVRLDSDTTPVNAGDQTALVEALRDQVGMLKHQLNTEQAASAELRRIIAALTSRIPELEAPRQEPPEVPTEDTEQPVRVESQAAVRQAQEGAERPWWRRMFGSWASEKCKTSELRLIGFLGSPRPHSPGPEGKNVHFL